MKTAANPVVLLAGARGAAGRMHQQIYESLGVPVVEFDMSVPPPPATVLRGVPWDEAIMDVCTPTDAHTTSLAWGYARGVRRFVVEKPAAPSLAQWRAQVSLMPGARILVVHPYLFSWSFRAALDEVGDLVDIAAVFNKDRAADDALGRGAGSAGRLPHIFQVELPHQMAMALALAPELRVVQATYSSRAGRGAEPDAPAAGAVTLHDPRSVRVTLGTNLRATRRRLLRLRCGDGRTVVVEFPTTADLTGRVWVRDPAGRTRMLFDGRDDLLRTTLSRVLASMASDSVAPDLSVDFAGAVLARIDEALVMARWQPAATVAKRLAGAFVST